jgi:uncharacterized repeat protein (TIGR01451 family)
MAVISILLTCAVMAFFVSQAGAYEINTAAPTGAIGAQTATLTTPSGMVTTVTTTGITSVFNTGITAANYGPPAGTFTPAIPLTTPEIQLETLTSNCGAQVSGTCPSGGTLTLSFLYPVTNPVINLSGVGGDTASGSNVTIINTTFAETSSTPPGATLGPVPSGSENLQVTGGNTISVINTSANTVCDSLGTYDAAATAGCGSVPIIGTISSISFSLTVSGIVGEGTGHAMNATGVGDAYVIGVSFPQESSDAPTSYDGTQAPAHVVGPLTLGPSITAASGAEGANPTASPYGGLSGAAVNTGAFQNALTLPMPSLTTAQIGQPYSVTVPISGTSSAAGEVCGYIDFSHAGTFTAAADQACTAFVAGATSAILNWTVPATTTAGLTYARLRDAFNSASGPNPASTPTGVSPSGEVEDYALQILPTVTVDKTIPAGTTGTFNLLVNGTTFAANVGNGGTTGAVTVGQNLGATITTPQVVVTESVSAGAVPVSVSETDGTGDTGFYTSIYTCVNGTGATVLAGTGTTIAASIPESASSNGLSQNITCTFTNTTQSPSLSVAKTASPSSVAAVGTTITYTFAATNTGNVTMSGVAIADTLAAPSLPANLSAITCASLATPTGTCSGTSATLAPGQVATFVATYDVTQADVDAGSVNDSATATGTPPSGPAVTSNPSSASVPTDQSPALSIVKSATVSPAGDPDAAQLGDTIAYSYLVTNTGNVDLNAVAVSDPSGGPTSCPSTTLAPAASETCTATNLYSVTQADVDVGSVTDIATANANLPNGSPIPNPPKSVVVTATVAPVEALSIVKMATVAPASDQGAAHRGDTIAYSYVVKNIGNVDLSDISVTDPTDGATTCPSSTLAPGASETCTAENVHTVTQADVSAGSVIDTATATGNGPHGTPIPDPPSDTVSTKTVPSAGTMPLVSSESPTPVTAPSALTNALTGFNFALPIALGLALATSGSVFVLISRRRRRSPPGGLDPEGRSRPGKPPQ